MIGLLIFSSSSSGTIRLRMLSCLMLSQRSLKLSLLFKIVLFFLLLYLCEFHCLVLQFADLFCDSSSMLLNPSSIFFSSTILQLCNFCLELIIFSISLLEILLCSSILLLNSVSMFMTITWNSLSGKFLITMH